MFLTHGKSNFVWQLIPAFKYIQFPWRWLSMALLGFSLVAGAGLLLVKSKMMKRVVFVGLIVGVVVWNVGFFREDLWFRITDEEQFSGARWIEQTAASLFDYWPVFGTDVPSSAAPDAPIFSDRQGQILSFNKLSHSAEAKVDVFEDGARLEFPISYFPGWEARSDGKGLEIIPTEKYGQIGVVLDKGQQLVNLDLRNTLARTIGNWIGLVALLGWIGLYFKKGNMEVV